MRPEREGAQCDRQNLTTHTRLITLESHPRSNGLLKICRLHFGVDRESGHFLLRLSQRCSLSHPVANNPVFRPSRRFCSKCVCVCLTPRLILFPEERFWPCRLAPLALAWTERGAAIVRRPSLRGRGPHSLVRSDSSLNEGSLPLRFSATALQIRWREPDCFLMRLRRTDTLPRLLTVPLSLRFHGRRQ